MSLPSCVPEISSKTKKEDAIQNLPDPPLLAGETSNNAPESCSHQPEQQSDEEYEATEARDREENHVETLLKQIPSPPSFLPDDKEHGTTCKTPVSSMSSVHHGAASGRSSLRRDSNTLSVFSFDSPTSRWSHDEVKLLWPLKVCLPTKIISRRLDNTINISFVFHSQKHSLRGTCVFFVFFFVFNLFFTLQ